MAPSTFRILMRTCVPRIRCELAAASTSAYRSSSNEYSTAWLASSRISTLRCCGAISTVTRSGCVLSFLAKTCTSTEPAFWLCCILQRDAAHVTQSQGCQRKSTLSLGQCIAASKRMLPQAPHNDHRRPLTHHTGREGSVTSSTQQRRFGPEVCCWLTCICWASPEAHALQRDPIRR